MLLQKTGEWTNEMNERLVDKICGDDRRIDAKSFAAHFDASLTHDKEEFIAAIDQFEKCAQFQKVKHSHRKNTSATRRRSRD